MKLFGRYEQQSIADRGPDPREFFKRENRIHRMEGGDIYPPIYSWKAGVMVKNEQVPLDIRPGAVNQVPNNLTYQVWGVNYDRTGRCSYCKGKTTSPSCQNCGAPQ